MAATSSNSNSMLAPLKSLGQLKELIIAAMVIAVVMIIIIPVPPVILDLLLSFSLTFGLVILLNTLFTTHPLQFSVFPSLLLVSTLLRLSLNISSTRLILSHGYAGRVVEAFGSFVVGGNYVVGMVIFLIITLIQFVVITNGAGRVAEVAARFTLDAMPGKQMSIDADLNAGIIDDNQARERRQELQREANFFGAMDGASKFVKGDAIAGIVITLVNILGGLVIGMWQLGMPIKDALSTYTILTVGDGLVSQIPALLISTATGIIVTRSASGESFGAELTRQITAFPKVIGLASGILFILGLIPRLPKAPFFILAAAAGYVSYTLLKEEKRSQGRQEQAEVEVRQQRQPENVLSLFQLDALEIEIGYNLIPLTDEQQGGDLLDRLAAVRRQCATDLGIYVRPIRIRDNLQLVPNTYAFKLRGVTITKGEVMPGYYLAMNPGESSVEVKGIPTKEPTFGLPAWWVASVDKEEAEINGFTVVDATTVMITHLTEFIKGHAHELLGRQEVKELMDMVKESNSAVVEELTPDQLSLGEIQKVLQNLLKERVPIRDLVTILEAIANGARSTKDTDFLTEVARQALQRTISRLQASADGSLWVITLQPRLEQAIIDSLQVTQQGSYPALEPALTQKIFERLSRLVEDMAREGHSPVVLCSSRARLPFRRLVERFLPNLSVLSMSELTPDLEVEAVGTVMLD